MKVRRSAGKPALHIVFGTVDELARGRARILVTAFQARQYLGLSEGGFRLLTGRGELQPVAQLGKAELYFLDDVMALRETP